MDSMTNDSGAIRNPVWCEFGCEVRIYYDTIKFSDGLMIPIPRNVETDEIHNCPELDPANTDANFMPDEQDVYMEMADEQGGHFWDMNEVQDHMMEFDMQLEAIDGLEFKYYRDDIKKFLVKQLGDIPEFYDDIRISSAEETLPACLQTEDERFGIFQPVALLGKFYEMDGSLEDAKKCYEIQKEVSGNEKFWSSKIEEIDEQLRMNKQESLIKKQTEEEPKKPQTSQQEQDQISLEAVITKTYDFELDSLRTYAFSKINSNDMKTILKETKWYNHNNKTLIDKVREMQAKEETDTILPLDPTDWDYLDLADKIKILQPHINRNIKNYLWDIRRHRNAILAHPKRYKKQDLEQRNKMIILYIQECKDFFEKAKNA